MICLTCTEPTVDEALSVIAGSSEYIDCAELRMDCLRPEQYESVRSFPSRAGISTILTFRKPSDGGAAVEISEKARLDLLSKLAGCGFDYVDIEYGIEGADAAAAEAELNGCGVIRSLHDFNGVPDNLLKTMREMSCKGRYIPKAAVMPRNSAELRKLLDMYSGLAADPGRFILLGMGAAGFPTRVLAVKMGAMLTFASPPGKSAAPGHISPGELCRIYRLRETGPETRVFGIMGRPVMHSRSPLLHNGWYEAAGIDAVYVPFETDNPADLMGGGVPAAEGFSVTVPHKQKAAALVSVADDAVKAIGACNTVVRNGGLWEGYNTDWQGFLHPLQGIELSGRRVLVIGAEGRQEPSYMLCGR